MAKVILAINGFGVDSRDLNTAFLAKCFSHAFQVTAIIRDVIQHFQKFYLTCCSFQNSSISN